MNMNELENISGILDIVSELHNAISHGVNGAMAIVFAIVAVAGLFQCFFGYKMMRVCFAICGFGIGAVGAGLAVGLSVSEAAPAIIAALIGGILGALLLFHVYRLGVFVMNFALVAVLVLLFGGASDESLILGVIAGVISGIVAAIMVRVWTILSTGASGGMCAGLAIGSIINVPYIGAVLGFALAIGGIIFQFKTTRKTPKTVSQQPQVVIIPAAETPAAPKAEPVKAVKVEKAAAPRRESRVIPAIRSTAGALWCIVKNLLAFVLIKLVSLASRVYYALKLKVSGYKPAH